MRPSKMSRQRTWQCLLMFLGTLIVSCFSFQASSIHAPQVLKTSAFETSNQPFRYDSSSGVSDGCLGSNQMLLLPPLQAQPKNQEEDAVDSVQSTPFSVLMISLPFMSAIFPLLLEFARGQTTASDQIAALALLFGANRLYLYGLSTTIVALVAFRSSRDDTRLGQRVVDLTEEILYNPPLNQDKSTRAGDTVEEEKTKESPAMIQSLSSSLGDSLDEVSDGTQAILLPLVVSALLAFSVFVVQIINLGPSTTSDGSPNVLTDLATSIIETYLPVLSQGWNCFVLSIFARCEIRRLSFELNSPVKEQADLWLPWLMGLSITGIAFFGGDYFSNWPAQNFVNMGLAVVVSRAIQLNQVSTTVLALALLTAYDATSTLLLQVQPANAVDPQQAASASAMGAVAMNKLTSQNFQPGLLVTQIGGRLGGALGLGDAVFPSLLAAIAKKYDQATEEDRGGSLFVASMVGYIIGCLSCELVPFLSTTGVPALLLIIPFMLASVFLTATIRGDAAAFWEFDASSPPKS